MIAGRGADEQTFFKRHARAGEGMGVNRRNERGKAFLIFALGCLMAISQAHAESIHVSKSEIRNVKQEMQKVSNHIKRSEEEQNVVQVENRASQALYQLSLDLLEVQLKQVAEKVNQLSVSLQQVTHAAEASKNSQDDKEERNRVSELVMVATKKLVATRAPFTFSDPPVQETQVVQGKLQALQPVVENGGNRDEWRETRVSLEEAKSWKNTSDTIMSITLSVPFRCVRGIGYWVVIQDESGEERYATQSYYNGLYFQHRMEDFDSWNDPIETRESLYASKGVLGHEIVANEAYPEIPFTEHSLTFFL
ncbi:MAG: hypothetical protein KDD55_10060, partial [Bdellovibrionales bacterium]|nr:hypothetical protein [Bdellovibrionales bacterium]